MVKINFALYVFYYNKVLEKMWKMTMLFGNLKVKSTLVAELELVQESSKDPSFL
jgi:hypothetical protein